MKFTDLGRKFVASDRQGQQTTFAEQVFKLRLFHIIIAFLSEFEETDAGRVIKDISSALPYDNPEKTFETMIAWGRHAGLMDFNAKTNIVCVTKDDEVPEDVDV